MEALSMCDGCDSMQEHVEKYAAHITSTGEQKVVRFCRVCHGLAQASRILDIEITSPPLS